MTFPSEFIANSDLGSTPAPLSGAKEIVLTTPASQYVSALSVVEHYSEIIVDEEFDIANYILTCDEEPSLCAYNWYLELDQYGVKVDVCVVPMGNRIRLLASYTSLYGATFTGSYTFRAVVVPVQSPYSQS